MPTASVLTSDANFTAGYYKPFSIKRYHPSCTHTVNLYVAGTWIKRVEGVGTYGQFTFDTSEQTQLFTILAQRDSVPCIMSVTTYYGGQSMGTTSIVGTMSAPKLNQLSFEPTVTIGNNISGSIVKNLDTTYCNAKLYTEDGTTELADFFTNTTDAFTFDSSTIADTIYNMIPNSTTYRALLKVWTMYNGVQVRNSSYDYYVYFNVPNSSAPTWDDYSILYYDSNATVSGVTGDNTCIVQDKSELVIKIDDSKPPTANNYATMSSYIIECANQTTSIDCNSAPLEAYIGTIDSSADQTVKVYAVDSRGLKTMVSKIIPITSYSKPMMTVSVARTNNFENETTLTSKILCCSVLVNGTEVNSLSSFKYHYRQSGGSYNALISDTTTGFPSITKDVVIDLDNQYSYDLEVVIEDAFGSTLVKTCSVGSGIPIFYIDWQKESLGFKKVPALNNTFELDGSLINKPAATWKNSDYGIDMKKSDIINANSVIFNKDFNTTNGGILFPKSTTTEGSTTLTDYDKLTIVDKNVYINSELSFTSDKFSNAIFTSSGVLMSSTHSYTMPKTLSECQNGWCLVWTKYDPTTATVYDDNVNYWYIPKHTLPFITSTIEVSNTMNCNSTPVNKRLFINNSTITGMDANVAVQDSSYNYYSNNKLVLRWVLEW